MNAVEKLNQIKKLFSLWGNKETFAKYQLADGTEVVVKGDLAENSSIYQINEDETTTPLMDGDYILQGKTLKVMGGIIGSILTADEILGDNSVPERIKEEIKQQKMAEEKVMMVSDALMDGTEIVISGDQVTAGAELRIVKDGEKLLPPAGKHKLKSGVEVEVDEEGKIISVEKIEEEPSVEIEVESAEQKPAEDVKDSGVKDVQDMMKQIMEAVESLKQKMGDYEKDKEKMKEEFKAFKKEPAGEPLKRNSNHYQFGSGEDHRVQMIEKLRQHNK